MRWILIALLAPLGLQAEDMDIPLALTSPAHPSLKTTPTAGELAKSKQYLKSGLAFLKKGNPQRAINEFNDSVRLAPTAENYKALGTAYFQAEDKAKAAWAYRESLQLKKDKQVQELVNSLEGRDGSFSNRSDESNYERLMESARTAEKKGKRDSALRDYLEANALKDGVESRLPAGRLAAAICEDYIKSKATAKAIETLSKIRHAYQGAKDLEAEEMGFLARLDKVESKVVEITGEKLREHEVNMQSDRERWLRTIREKEAGKSTKIKIEAE